MEPNKLENEIKEKLAQRTINPTPMAWDRLDAMLSVAEQAPKKKPNRTWMYMAACFLALLLAGTFFLNQDGGNSHNPVDNNTNGVVTNGQPENNKGAQAEGNTVQDGTLQNNNTVTGAVAGTGGSSSSKNNQKQQYRAGHGTTVQPVSPGFDPAGPVEPQRVQTQGHRVTVNPDALLASVTGTTKPNAAKATQPKVTVDPNALLSGIEGEMETNFRGRMLDKLAKNYNEVKDAVATRNYN